MRKALSRYRLCAVPVAICCLVALAAAPAEAGQLVRSSGQQVHGGHGVAQAGASHLRHGRYKARRFDRHRVRPNVVRRADRKRRHRHVSRYAYGYGGYYGYGGGYRDRAYPRNEPGYRSETEAAVQPHENRPVTPKWVHVGGGVAPFTAEGLPAGGGLRTNCLSVKTEITVDGRPVDAFGEACLLADGTWQLKPAQETE